jgi:hypothetical protein
MWQFKILNGIHNTKSNLEKWKITENNICELCLNNQSEDNFHYFINCPYNKNLLREIYQKAGNILKTNIKITNSEYITGIWSLTSEDKYLLAFDKILFFGRMFLIKSRRAKIPVDMNSFLEFMITNLEIENTVKEFRPSRLFTFYCYFMG